MNKKLLVFMMSTIILCIDHTAHAQVKKEKSSSAKAIEKDINKLVDDVVKELNEIDWKGVDEHVKVAAGEVEKSAKHLAASAEQMDTKKLEKDLNRLSENLQKTKTFKTLKKNVDELSKAIEEDLK